MVDAEEEAAEVESDKKEDRKVEEDEEAEGDGGVDKAGNLTNLGIERREVGRVEDLTEKSDSSEDQRKAPSKSWVVEEFRCWTGEHTHRPEGPDHVETGDRHPAKHGEVAEETKESKDGAAEVTWRMVWIVVVDN